MQLRTPLAPPELRVPFGARDEESAPLCEQVDAAKVQIPAAESIKSTLFRKQLVEKAEVVDCAAGHLDVGWNASAQIEQGMHLDGTFVAMELRPSKHRRTKIDGRGIQRINRLGRLHSERFVAIRFASGPDEDPGEIAKDVPGARLVGLRQSAARDA